MFSLFRQWKLEDLCYKSGELVTETHVMNQVRCTCFFTLTLTMNVLFFSVYTCCYQCVSTLLCVVMLFVQLDHRRATSLPHHHPFGLFLGGSQAPVWNGLSPVSTRNSFFFLWTESAFYDVSAQLQHGQNTISSV